MAVSQRLRYEVLRRDNHCCRYCGAAAPDVPLTVDHVIPVALGGSDDPSNLATACRPCNSGKSASAPDAPLVADVAEDAARWSRAMSAAAAAARIELHVLSTYIVDVDRAWSGWTSSYDDLPYGRPSDWRAGVEAFLRAEVGGAEWEYAIRKAMENPRVRYDQKWRYTCGILWRRLSERTQAALLIVDQMSTDETGSDI